MKRCFLVLFACILAGLVASSPATASASGVPFSWGDNYYGQLGDGTTNNRITPAQISGLTNIIAVSAGCSHSLAVITDGSVWAWGRNEDGRVGDGSGYDALTPAKVVGLTNAV